MTAIIVICSLLLATLAVVAIFMIMLYTKLSQMMLFNGAYQAEEYRKAVAQQKVKKPSLPVVKEEVRGRSIVKQEELVDIADLNWEDGYKAVEELGK